MRRGIVYVITGSPVHAIEAVCSIRSLRDVGCKLPVVVFTDMVDALQEPLAPYMAKVVAVRVGQYHCPKPSRAIKTMLGQLTPFDQTLFLDTDILAVQPIDRIWSLLREGHDLWMSYDGLTVRDCHHGTQAEIDYSVVAVPECADLFQHNSGVMLWNNTSKVRSLFSCWHREWTRFGDIDQLALMRAIVLQKFSTGTLHWHYNCSSTIEGFKERGLEVVFWHHYWDSEQVLEHYLGDYYLKLRDQMLAQHGLVA